MGFGRQQKALARGRSCAATEILHPPVPIGVALADLRVILGSPSLVLLSETPRHAEVMEAPW